MVAVDVVNVFTCEGRGGNPCPIVLRADELTSAQMQNIAREFGHESGFVLRPPRDDFDFKFRFFVPNHEMEMCGHATIAALWLLARRGRLDTTTVRIDTQSGAVTGFISCLDDEDASVEITQPPGKVKPLAPGQEADVLSVLELSRDDVLEVDLLNAITSRTKTLVPLKHVDRLQALRVDMSAIEAVCDRLGSTGLYPFAPVDAGARIFEARQFPRSSGYAEDPATGIAASALAFGLLHWGLIDAVSVPIRILQGRAMGRLSEIRIRIGFVGGYPIGCLLGGSVTP